VNSNSEIRTRKLYPSNRRLGIGNWYMPRPRSKQNVLIPIFAAFKKELVPAHIANGYKAWIRARLGREPRFEFAPYELFKLRGAIIAFNKKVYGDLPEKLYPDSGLVLHCFRKWFHIVEARGLKYSMKFIEEKKVSNYSPFAKMFAHLFLKEQRYKLVPVKGGMKIPQPVAKDFIVPKYDEGPKSSSLVVLDVNDNRVPITYLPHGWDWKKENDYGTDLYAVTARYWHRRGADDLTVYRRFPLLRFWWVNDQLERGVALCKQNKFHMSTTRKPRKPVHDRIYLGWEKDFARDMKKYESDMEIWKRNNPKKKKRGRAEPTPVALTSKMPGYPKPIASRKQVAPVKPLEFLRSLTVNTVKNYQWSSPELDKPLDLVTDGPIKGVSEEVRSEILRKYLEELKESRK